MRKLWFAFTAVVVLSFAVLGWIGVRIYQEAPPIPTRVVTTDGRRGHRSRRDLTAARTSGSRSAAWRSGSIWGHGSYVAPDWTADWLHREAIFILDRWAAAVGTGYAALPPEQQAALQSRLQRLMRTNTYDSGHGHAHGRPGAGRGVRGQRRALHATCSRNGRAEYAIPPGALTDPDRLRKLSAFFFWTSWAASTNRPGRHDHLHEQLAARAARRQPAHRRAVVWTGVSIIMLLAGIGAMASWLRVAIARHGLPAEAPANDPLLASVATPSQRAAVKYFWVVSALILVQILLGVVTAHYGVEGNGVLRHPARRSGCRTA